MTFEYMSCGFSRMLNVLMLTQLMSAFHSATLPIEDSQP